MTRHQPSEFTSNFLYDQHLCLEWAVEAGLLARLAADHPLVHINRMTVRQYLNRALGYLAQSGVPLRDVWELSDLVTPEAFKKITCAALASSPGTARCISIVLIAVGREWVGLDADVLAELGYIADRIPPAVHSSKRRHVEVSTLANVSKRSIRSGRRGLEALA